MDGQLYARLDSFNKFIVEHHKHSPMMLLPESFPNRNCPAICWWSQGKLLRLRHG